MSESRQQIRFCKSADGTRIAYATTGSGPPLVYASGWPTHLELEWGKPFMRRFLEDLAQGFTLLRYDMRGTGLSDRDVDDLSLEALVGDLGAVVESAGFERFALLSLGDLGGPVAITYAAQRPERVTRLVLNGAYARGKDLAPPERQEAIIGYVRSFGFPSFEFTDSPGVGLEEHRHVREMVEESASNEMVAGLLRTMYKADVGPLLATLRLPVLVLHGRGDTFVPLELGRDVASRIAGAEFVPFDGTSAVPWAYGDVIVREARRFLEATESAPDVAGMTEREIEILRLVAQGLSNRRIAEQLMISVNTVDRHVSNIYGKIGATNRAEAASFAVRNGLA